MLGTRKRHGPVVFRAPAYSSILKDPYKRSNSVKLEFTPTFEVKEALLLFKESVSLQNDELIQRTGQVFLSLLNDIFGITAGVELSVMGKRPSRRRSDPLTGKRRIMSSVHGKYFPNKAMIALYTLTATGRRVAFKTLFNTLIHEFCHHLDYKHPTLGLSASLHTKGFYDRLNAIYAPLKDV